MLRHCFTTTHLHFQDDMVSGADMPYGCRIFRKSYHTFNGNYIALYILVGYMYFITASHYLKINKEVRSYYISHWWCVLLLPFFNLAVFFIRMAGIINSIQTDSSWKTKTLTQECAEFAGVVKSDLKKVTGIIEKIRHKVNVSADVNDRK